MIPASACAGATGALPIEATVTVAPAGQPAIGPEPLAFSRTAWPVMPTGFVIASGRTSIPAAVPENVSVKPLSFGAVLATE